MEIGSSDQLALWDEAVRRSTIDREFRERLLDRPGDALREMGIEVGSATIIVHEFREDERLLILPPLVEEASAPSRSSDARPASGPPSPPMRGVAHFALLDPSDDRVYYGT